MPRRAKVPSHSRRGQTVAPPKRSSDPRKEDRSAAQWHPLDDERLMKHRKAGLGWKSIALLFDSKTPNACRKHHERLIQRQNSQYLDGIKLEVLAREYMNVREEMWSVLAKRMGEKWATVEVKCMEHGLKNLQAAHRAGQRKQRGSSAVDEGRGNDYEADSGIGYSDAEIEAEDCTPELEAVGASHGEPAHRHPQPEPVGDLQGGQKRLRGSALRIEDLLEPMPHPGC